MAEAVLHAAATFHDRLMLLRRLVTIDVPLRDGNGNLRFRQAFLALIGINCKMCGCVALS